MMVNTSLCYICSANIYVAIKQRTRRSLCNDGYDMAPFVKKVGAGKQICAVIHADFLESHQEAGKAGSLGEDGGQGGGYFSLNTRGSKVTETDQ